MHALQVHFTMFVHFLCCYRCENRRLVERLCSCAAAKVRTRQWMFSSNYRLHDLLFMSFWRTRHIINPKQLQIYNFLMYCTLNGSFCFFMTWKLYLVVKPKYGVATTWYPKQREMEAKPICDYYVLLLVHKYMITNIEYICKWTQQFC
mgnify:CR=1 FL=1